MNSNLEAPIQILKFSPKQMIYYTGDPAQSVFRVHEGLIRITRLTPEGRQVTLRHLVPGDYFGEGVFSNGNREELAESLTKAEIESIDPHQINYKDLQIITQSLAKQIQRLMTHECHLQTGNLRQRVERYLLDLSETPLCHIGDMGRPTVSATHELIAEGSACTRESVSKIITDFREDGFIESGYRTILLLDVSGLRNTANGAILA